MITNEMNHMILRFSSLLWCWKIKAGNKGAIFNFLAGIHIRNMMHQKEASSYLQLIPLVAESFEIRTMIY
jgi:hypothetical protein